MSAFEEAAKWGIRRAFDKMQGRPVEPLWYKTEEYVFRAKQDTRIGWDIGVGGYSVDYKQGDLVRVSSISSMEHHVRPSWENIWELIECNIVFKEY